MSTFSQLWENHPSVESVFDDYPCKKGDTKAFDNQCGIRLSVALQAVEILLTWSSTALKPSSKCSFTRVNSAFSLDFALYLTQFSEFQQPVKKDWHWNRII